MFRGSRPGPLLAATFVAVLALALTLSAAASATTRIYWTQKGIPEISAGTIGGNPKSLIEGMGEAIVLDPAAGKMYWSEKETSEIKSASLEASGGAPGTLYTSAGSPTAMSIDPVGGKIYWVKSAGNEIVVANLDGSGTPQRVLQASVPIGAIAVDPVAKEIYWAERREFPIGDEEIKATSLDGSSPERLVSRGLETGSNALAVDPGKAVYATPTGTDFESQLRKLPLSSEPAETLWTASQGFEGLAIVPEKGTGYVTTPFHHAIESIGLTLGAGTHAVFEGLGSPHSLAVLESPVATAPPAISGGTEVGEALTCAPGGFAPDLPSALLFRAPTTISYRWLRDGVVVPEVDGPTLVPSAEGEFVCEVEATNAAGKETQKSAGYQVTPRPPSCSDPLLSTAYGVPVGGRLSCDGVAPLSYELLGQPEHGTVTGFDAESGNFVYTPEPGFSGGDSFSFRASSTGGASSPARVEILVAPPAPSCAAASFTASAGRAGVHTLRCDGRGRLTYRIVAPPAHGSVEGLDPETGRFEYVPEPGFTGTDSFGFAAANTGGSSEAATASISVLAPPRALIPALPDAPGKGKPGKPGGGSGGQQASNRFSFLGGGLRGTPSRPRLGVRVPGAGRLTVRGQAVRTASQRAAKAGAVWVGLRLRSKAKAELAKRGKVRLRLRVTFAPRGGRPATRATAVVLRAGKRGPG